MKTKDLAKIKVGITGATGKLGKALTKEFREQGAYVIGFTHRNEKNNMDSERREFNELINWSCGNENLLQNKLSELDILVLNHGINPKSMQTKEHINKALEINALSTWKLMQIFETIASESNSRKTKKELWVNTSEAEIQIALSPLYEISKRLLGEIVSLRKVNLFNDEKNFLKIRKLVIGPFRSDLNPIGIMEADYVAKRIIKKSSRNSYLIIVTPNPITHVLMPIVEFSRSLYANLVNKLYS